MEEHGEIIRGTMRQKMTIFKEGNSVCRGPKILKDAAELGGDASENGDFQRENQRLQGYKFFQELSFHILNEK